MAATFAAADRVQAQTWWEYRSIEEAVWTSATDTEGTLWVVKGINDITEGTLALTNCQDLVPQITKDWVLRSTKIIWANESYAGIKPCGDKNLGWVAVVESESYVKTGLKEQAFAFSMGENVSCSPDDKALLLCVHVHVVETTNNLPTPLPPWTPKATTEYVRLSINGNGAITEGGNSPSLVLTATLSGTNTSGKSIRIPIQIHPAGTTAQPEDYTISSSISIPNGHSTGTTTFTVINDSKNETDETVIIKLGSSLPTGISAGSPDRVEVTIHDDDESADNTDNNGTKNSDNDNSDEEMGRSNDNADNRDNTSTDNTADDNSDEEMGRSNDNADNRDNTSTDNTADDNSDEKTADSDRGILSAVYKASGGSRWTRNDNWNSNRPLGTWYGIATDSDTRVTKLRLEDNNLVGTLHEDIGKLEKLEVLQLNDNKLAGVVPTAKLEALTNLKELALWGNDGLSGTISDELGKRVDRAVLRTLNEINGASSLEGWFPEDETDPFSYSVWNGVTTNKNERVSELDLSGLGLSGQISVAISALYALEELDLSGNPDLKGELPQGLAELTNLRELDISHTGLCPPEDETFALWIKSDHLTFTGNDNCGRDDESKPAGETRSEGSGGCAVASGNNESEENVFRLILVALVMTAALGGNNMRARRKKNLERRGVNTTYHRNLPDNLTKKFD